MKNLLVGENVTIEQPLIHSEYYQVFRPRCSFCKFHDPSNARDLNDQALYAQDPL